MPDCLTCTHLRPEGHLCLYCRHWYQTGIEHSGLAGGWTYEVGRCKHPEPELGGAMVDRDNLAYWLCCYQWQGKREKANK